MRRLLILFVCAVFGIGWQPLSFAATQDKPTAAVHDRNIDAIVTLDAKLNAYPDLYGKLLATGKREMAKWVAEAGAEREENPDWFEDPDWLPEGRRWAFERSYKVRSIVGRYVSIVHIESTFTGGAHENHTTYTLLWDVQTKKLVNIAPFFSETKEGGPTLSTLAEAIRAAVAVERRSTAYPEPESELQSKLHLIKPKLTALGSIALEPSTEPGKSAGLIAYFSPYDFGSYEGDYTVFVPWTAFKAYLSTEGRARFGGNRPDSDADKDKNDR
jgi:hypothetical protein